MSFITGIDVDLITRGRSCRRFDAVVATVTVDAGEVDCLARVHTRLIGFDVATHAADILCIHPGGQL